MITTQLTGKRSAMPGFIYLTLRAALTHWFARSQKHYPAMLTTSARRARPRQSGSICISSSPSKDRIRKHFKREIWVIWYETLKMLRLCARSWLEENKVTCSKDGLPRWREWSRTHLPMQETWETWVWSLGGEDPLEKGMAIHSSVLAWRIAMDRGAWPAAVHGVTKRQTRLSS